MKKHYINNLEDQISKEIVSYFAISEKNVRKTKSGKPYIRVSCVDSTGQIIGNIWNNAQTLHKNFAEGDIVKIQALVEMYLGSPQLNITNIRTAKENEYDISDFLEKTPKDINELIKELFKFIDTVKSSYLNQLLHLIFDDKEFLKKYAKAPAAKTWHHNFIGGLIHHSITVTKICDAVSNFYENIDRDLLVSCALFHDIGKIEEYYIKPFIDFTDTGKLIGHIVLGNKKVVDTCEQINNFPKKLKLKIQHLLLSHHGEREKGAVVLPKTKEAILLHFADNMDAQTIGADSIIKKAINEKKTWSNFDKLSKREYFTE